MTGAGSRVVACRWPSCRAPVRVWPAVGGTSVRVDAEPVAVGTVVWTRAGGGWRLRVLEEGEQPAAGAVRFMPHAMTCMEPAAELLRRAFPGSALLS